MLSRRIASYLRHKVVEARRARKYQVSAELTNHCNFRCKLCPHSVYQQPSEAGNRFDREKGFMSEELFSCVLENAEKYAHSLVFGFFGEPMLHPKFEEFIASIPAERDYELVLNSNWSLVTRQNMEVLKRFDSVRISIDSSHSQLYEVLCPGADLLDLDGVPSDHRYETLVEKIGYWLDLPGHPPTILIYAVSSFNEDDRQTFLDEWLPRVDSQDRIATKSIISYGGVMKNAHMTEHPCNTLNEKRMIVAWNGDCTPCNLDVNIALKMGNLLEDRDIERIVHGSRHEQALDKIRNRDGICANCSDANNRNETVFHCGQRKQTRSGSLQAVCQP